MADYDPLVRRTLLQLLALTPIPLIVVLILWSGKRPLPPPVSLKAKAQSGSAVEKILPKKFPSGFARAHKPERFNKKSLFDRINGAAPTYLAAGYQSSFGVEYKRRADKDPVTIDLYDMGRAAFAFGLYTKESDASYRFVKVGDGGYLAAGSLNFWFGKYYVKLAGFEEGAAMDKALTTLAGDLIKGLGKRDDAAAVHAAIAKLPSEGQKANTAGYSKPALSGIAGLERTFFARYTAGEATYRIFLVVEKDAAAAAQRLSKVSGYFKGQAGVKIDLPEDGEDKKQVIVTSKDEASKVEEASLVIIDKQLMVGALDFPATSIEGVRKALIETLDKVGPK